MLYLYKIFDNIGKRCQGIVVGANLQEAIYLLEEEYHDIGGIYIEKILSDLKELDAKTFDIIEKEFIIE